MAGDDTAKVGAQVADIIWQSAQKEGVPEGMTREQFLGRVAKLVQQGAMLWPIDKTVLMIKPISQGVAEIHTFTTEDGRMLVQRYVQAAQIAKKYNIKHIISYADSPAFVKMAKATGLPVKITQTTKMQNGQMRPMYQFDLDL